MSNITITNFEGELVVDSRLIAEELGIDDIVFIRIIRQHLIEFKQLDVLYFKEGKPINANSQGGLFCFLNEDQAIQAILAVQVTRFIDNIDVLDPCRNNLIKSFSEAKKVIKTVIPQQSDRVKELELELDGRSDTVVEKNEKVTETIVCKEDKNISHEEGSTSEVEKDLGFKGNRQQATGNSEQAPCVSTRDHRIDSVFLFQRNPRNIAVDLPDDIILYAFRYCITRQSYAVDQFVNWLTPYIPLLRVRFKEFLIEEIEYAEKSGDLGIEDYHNILWRSLKETLKNSLGKEDNHVE